MPGGNELPGWVLAGLILLVWAILLAAMVGSMLAFAGAMMVILTDGIMAALVLAAAAGYGYAVFRLAAPAGTPRLLALATSAALGLWMLSTAVLILGSVLPGAMGMSLWWPVVGVGVAIALAQAHRALGRVRLPGGFSGGSLVWVLAAAAGGIWLAGAAMPPGWMGNLTMDSYDVLEYHLQLPREYYHAGRVATLDHNVYSHFPLGAEMLCLLAMCLRGGAYEGMYLAQLMSGLYAAVAVAGVFGGLRAPDAEPSLIDDFRSRAALALLATAPWVIYFSWLAMPELAQISYLALALVWLRRWLRSPSARLAGWIGAMLGAACAVKYLSVGLIAAPVIVAMAAAALRRPRRPGQVAAAAGVAALLFCPWLIRNAAATGNPVFPLATSTFGRGHLSEECARRWRDGHAPEHRPPVPVPPGYAPPPRLSRARRFSAFLLDWPKLGHPALGAGVLVIAVGAAFAMFARRRGVDPWDWALLGVVAVQMLVWALFTRDMPARFIAVSVAPISLLSAGGLARLASVRQVRWLRQPAGIGGRWGMAPAGMLLLAATAMNLGSAGRYFSREMLAHRQRGWADVRPAGLPGSHFARLPDLRGRVMLVGDAATFYYPAGTVYATVFDTHPLQRLIGRGDLAAALAERDITHVGVHWAEVSRLRHTYGWPEALSPARLTEAFAGWPVARDVRSAAAAPGEAPARVFTLYAVPGPAAAALTRPAATQP